MGFPYSLIMLSTFIAFRGLGKKIRLVSNFRNIQDQSKPKTREGENMVEVEFKQGYITE